MTIMTEPACSCAFCNDTLRTGTLLQALSSADTLSLPADSTWVSQPWRREPYETGTAYTLPVGLILEGSLLSASYRKPLRRHHDLRRLLQRGLTSLYRAAAHRYIYRHLRDVHKVRPAHLADLKATAEAAQASATAYLFGARMLNAAHDAGLPDVIFDAARLPVPLVRLARHDGYIMAELWYDRRGASLSA